MKISQDFRHCSLASDLADRFVQDRLNLCMGVVRITRWSTNQMG